MIIKKLAVPLINDKILQQAEHGYIATAAITDAGFDFIRTRLPGKTKLDIVTGLDGLTSPGVLKRIWRHYQDRFTVRIYTRNIFHANVYIFELPFRKSVGFTGSGALTLEGLKDHEEIFNKVTDVKEVEALLSWYTTYYEFAEPITEEMIAEYELLYPYWKQREIASREEKKQFIALTSRAFSWDGIRFKTQYFKKEDYLVLSNAQADLDTEAQQTARAALKSKLQQLHESIQKHVTRIRLHADNTANISSLNPQDHADHKLTSIGMMYGRSEAELKRYAPTAQPGDFITLQVIVMQKNIAIALVPGNPGSGQADREFFRFKMQEEEYRKTFQTLLTALGSDYFIEVAGEQKPADSFQQPDILWEYTKADHWKHHRFIIGKIYQPGDAAIANETIVQTVEQEFEKLMALYQHLKDPKGAAV
jgi:hypothetical protein